MLSSAYGYTIWDATRTKQIWKLCFVYGEDGDSIRMHRSKRYTSHAWRNVDSVLFKTRVEFFVFWFLLVRLLLNAALAFLRSRLTRRGKRPVLFSGLNQSSIVTDGRALKLPSFATWFEFLDDSSPCFDSERTDDDDDADVFRRDGTSGKNIVFFLSWIGFVFYVRTRRPRAMASHETATTRNENAHGLLSCV